MPAPATTAPASKPAHGCRNCAQLMRAVSYWQQQAKDAIKKRDELDKTILSMDGGIGHWRRICKDISVLLFERRSDDRKRVAEIVKAAAEREEDVERRISAARDVLYKLKKSVGVDTPIGQEIHSVWSTL